MAVSQGSIIESLEQICSSINRSEFIFSFLDAYGFPKSTITRLRKGDDNRNVGVGSDIGLRKQLYFRAVEQGADVATEAEFLVASDLITRNDIRFVIVTDFENLVAFDLKADERLEVEIKELDKNYGFFLPLAGYEKAIMFTEHPADLKASEKMGQLFDLIRERNDLTKPEDIHALNVFLTRLLFCFYAEDTGIFDEGQMTYTIQSYTQEDGSDLDQFFTDLFAVLNLPESSVDRQKMSAHFQAFKYVNGGLFRDDEPVPEFSRRARRIVLECARLDWSQINPDIFGSMFQAVIDEEQRGNLGQHYTSVTNIMKVIQPLFLDPLYDELEKSRGSDKKLKALLLRIESIKIFDPACGSGNFLIIAYKELRRLEMQVIDALNATGQQSEMYYSGIKLSQFYGIEIDDFASEIATLALWLAEHQMNLEFKAKFGYAGAALPLKGAGNIACGNSLRMNWEQTCPPTNGQGNLNEVYICGNPPFDGARKKSKEQAEDLQIAMSGFSQLGNMDYVAAFYWKGANYIKNSNAKCALVSTNSISQGIQPALLWDEVFKLGVSISFCYRTFVWKNSAKNNAAVHVVIIGLKNEADNQNKPKIYEYQKNELTVLEVSNISPYLLEGSNLSVKSRSKPIANVSPMNFGSMPNDGGFLLLDSVEKEKLISQEPLATKWIKPLLGSEEFINAKQRFCLWLVEATSDEIANSPLVQHRVTKVREKRLDSDRLATKLLAETPHLFGEIRQPRDGNYILVPRVSSERRRYIPIGFLDSKVIASDACLMIPNATLYEFGILTSEMHNDWMRTVAGRLKSDYRYSATLVYNTFPWPDASETKRKKIETLAEEVILTREDYPDKTLAELYDPDKMPEPLLEAHKALDKAVESLYRDRPFRDASERLEHLFARYEKLIEAEKNKPPKKKAKESK